MSEYKEKIRSLIHGVYANDISYDLFLKNKYKNYKNICIFGAGNVGLPTAKEMIDHGIKVDFFCDNDRKKHGTMIEGIPCISVQELFQIKNDTMVIICGRAYEAIFEQLRNMSFLYLDRLHVNKFRIRDYMKYHTEEELIEQWDYLLGICEDELSRTICIQLLNEWCTNESNSLKSICSDDQYFCRDIIKFKDNEIIVDGGAYIGDTLEQFINNKISFERYYMFELSKKSFEQLEKNILSLGDDYDDKIVRINSGLSDRSGYILYNEEDEGSRVTNADNFGTKGTVTTIDETCIGSRVSFIKMDIEGSELDALIGAKGVIKSYHPKLAICLYHNPEDMWEIPQYIKRISPDYKIYIRHHTELMNETVCYAI